MAYKYLENKIYKPNKFFRIETSATDYDIGVGDFRSINIENLKNVINSFPPDYFAYMDISPNTNMEKVALDIYDNADYQDILYVINDRSPLLDNPYDYDVLVEQTKHKIRDYEKKIGRTLSEKDYERLYEKYEDEILEENNIKLEIKYIKQNKLYEVLSYAYSLGVLSSDMRLYRV